MIAVVTYTISHCTDIQRSRTSVQNSFGASILYVRASNKDETLNKKILLHIYVYFECVVSQGSGTREGSGKCSCNFGYQGTLCTECMDEFFPEEKNETHTICQRKSLSIPMMIL